MEKNCACPDAEQLARLLSDELSEDEQQQWTQHLDDCESCQQKLQEWIFTEPSLANLAEVLQGQVPGKESALQKVLQQCQQPAQLRGADISGNNKANTSLVSTPDSQENHLPDDRDGGQDRRTDFSLIGHVRLRNADESRTPLPQVDAGAWAETLRLSERYQLAGEIARGGMGAILKGHDVDLGRDIAFKVMLETETDTAELLQRFVEEAQIGGQLQHPGIVPVYDLGQSADKRLYFTMKLVRGKTLAALLQERDNERTEDRDKTPAEQEPPAGTSSEPSATLERDEPQTPDLPRLLGIFEQVCQTIAYAHSRGVIHRDLKPSNIMVGSFGEVQVMDWGLAKVLANGKANGDDGQRLRKSASAIPSPTQDALHTPHLRDAALTRAGMVLGTPAYMPPEQAKGEIDALDERCDVFGLGAILCLILTGEPPYTGTDNAEVHGKAMRAELDDARLRLENCGADAELIALAQRCLQPDKEQRPRNAKEVADAVRTYLDSVQTRLHQAEVNRARAEVKVRAERTRRWLGLGLAAAVVTLVIGLAGGAMWYQQEQKDKALRELRITQTTENAIRQMYELTDKGLYKEALALLKQNQKGLEKKRYPDLHQQLEQVEKDVKLAEALDKVRLRKARVVGFVNFAKVDREYEVAFAPFQFLTKKKDVQQSAKRIRTSRIKKQLVGALDDWADVARHTKRRAFLLALVRKVDPGPWRDRFRNPAVWSDAKALKKLVDKIDPGKLSPELMCVVAHRMRLAELDNIPLLKKAQYHSPEDFWLNLFLGMMLHPRSPEQAISYYRAALVARPNSVGACINLSDVLTQTGQLEESEFITRKAMHHMPNNASLYANLGHILAEQKRDREALVVLQKAIELDPNLAQPYRVLGSVLRNMKRFEQARTAWEKALAIDSETVSTYVNLGHINQDLRDFARAIQYYRRAVRRDPKYMRVWLALGQALLLNGNFVEAEDVIRSCLQKSSMGQKYYQVSFNLLRECQHLQSLEKKCGAFLAGERQPRTASECLELAELYGYKGRYLTSARHYTDAFQKQPNVATDTRIGYHYRAARVALWAAADFGKDASKLDDKERSQWRARALQWLRADLAIITREIKKDTRPLAQKTSRAALSYWLNDSDLVTIRHPEYMKHLSPQERRAWQQFWADVKAAQSFKR